MKLVRYHHYAISLEFHDYNNNIAIIFDEDYWCKRYFKYCKVVIEILLIFKFFNQLLGTNFILDYKLYPSSSSLNINFYQSCISKFKRFKQTKKFDPSIFNSKFISQSQFTYQQIYRIINHTRKLQNIVHQMFRNINFVKPNKNNISNLIVMFHSVARILQRCVQILTTTALQYEILCGIIYISRTYYNISKSPQKFQVKFMYDNPVINTTISYSISSFHSIKDLDYIKHYWFRIYLQINVNCIHICVLKCIDLFILNDDLYIYQWTSESNPSKSIRINMLKVWKTQKDSGLK